MRPFDRAFTLTLLISGLLSALLLLVDLSPRLRIIAISPDGADAPPVTTAIQVRFSDPVDHPSAESRFTIDPQVDGSFSWNADTLTFRPEHAFNPNEMYTVTLSSGIEGVFRRPTGKTTEAIFTPRQAGMLYLSPAQSGVQSLWYRPADVDHPVEFFAPAGGILDYAPAPDGQSIALSVYDSAEMADIWLLSTAEGQADKAISCAPAGTCDMPAWSPDGQLLAYRYRTLSESGDLSPGRIWLYTPSDASIRPFSDDPQLSGSDPQWSTDGSFLAFFDSELPALRVNDLATGRIGLLSSQLGQVGSFSPEGLEMIYTDIRPVGGQYFTHIWRVDLLPGGKILPLLGEESEEDRAAVWSPDGAHIAFVRRRLDRQEGNSFQLMLYTLSAGELRPLTTDLDYNTVQVVWSPDGASLFVQRFDLTQTPVHAEIWRYALADGQFEKIVDDAFNPQWLP